MTESDMRKIGINSDDAKKLLSEAEIFGAIVSRLPDSDTEESNSDDGEMEGQEVAEKRMARRRPAGVRFVIFQD